MYTDVIVCETYEPDFWKVAFSSKPEYVGSTACEFTAVSVSRKHIDSTALMTESHFSSSSSAAGLWLLSFWTRFSLLTLSYIGDHCPPVVGN